MRRCPSTALIVFFRRLQKPEREDGACGRRGKPRNVQAARTTMSVVFSFSGDHDALQDQRGACHRRIAYRFLCLCRATERAAAGTGAPGHHPDAAVDGNGAAGNADAASGAAGHHADSESATVHGASSGSGDITTPTDHADSACHDARRSGTGSSSARDDAVIPPPGAVADQSASTGALRRRAPIARWISCASRRGCHTAANFCPAPPAVSVSSTSPTPSMLSAND